MKVRQLIAALKEMPQDADVYVTDDGSASVDEWNASPADVSEVDGDVIIEFNGSLLRNAIDNSDSGSSEGWG